MASSVPQHEHHDKDAKSAERLMKQLSAALRNAVEVCVEPQASFAEREAAALELATEAVRRHLLADLEAIVQDHGDQDLLIDSKLFRLHRSGSGTYHSLVGPLEVQRPTYREVGVRNGPTVVPLEHQAGLMERATPAMAHRVVLGHAEGTSRDVQVQLKSSYRVPPSRSTLETMGKALGTSIADNGVSIEAVLRRSDALPLGAHAICVGLDRTTAPMEEDLLEASGPARKRKAPYVRKPPAPVEVNYRMLYIGTVAIVDTDGRVLRCFKYAATPEEGPDEILHRMMQDVRRARRQRSNLPVLVVQDAAKEMWSLIVDALEAEPTVGSWYEVIDIYHAREHLWAVATAIADVDPKQLMAEWNELLREDDDAVDTIRERINNELERPYFGPSRRILNDEQTYLDNNHERLHYAHLRNKGFPIGSGPTEGACKSLVSARVKRSGQRWRPPGLRAALSARTQHVNGRLDAFVATLRHRRYTADVALAA